MHKTYIVCPAYDNTYYKQTQHPTGYTFHVPKRAEDSPDLAFFFGEESAAHRFAAAQASINGGRELVVCEVVKHYFSKPSEVRAKIWKGSELIPQ